MARKKEMGESYATKQVRRQFRAKKLFTSREQECQLISDFLHAIADNNRAPKRPVISIYGVGGVGKSALLSHVWDDFCEQEPKSDIIQIHLDVDSDKAAAIPIIELMWNLRMQLFKETGASLLTFDFVYMKYMDKINEKVNLEEGPLRVFFDVVAKKSGMFGSLIRGIGSLVEAIPVGSVINLGLQHLKTLQNEHALTNRLEINLDDIDEWRAGDIERELPFLLVEDIGAYLAESGKSIVLVLDGYERISHGTERVLVEDFFGTLLLDEEHSKHFGLVLLGRERTNWSAYDDPNDTIRWNEDRITHCHLLGLAEDEVQRYINTGVEFYQGEGKQEVADLLEEYDPEICQACRESTTDEIPQSYHPFYLNICLETLETHNESFDPKQHLSKTPKEVMNRFFRYMDKSELSLHIALGLAVEFDWDLVAWLQHKSIIPSLTNTDFIQFAASHSYVIEEDPNEDSYRFNRLMQESLKTYVYTVDDIQKTALRKAVLANIINYYEEQLSGPSNTLSQSQSRTARVYTRGNLVLTCAVDTGLMSIQDAYAQHQEWSTRYRGEFFNLRMGWNRIWVEKFAQTYGKKHPETRQALQGWLGSLDDMLDAGRKLLLEEGITTD